MGATTYADIAPLEPEWEVPGLVPKSFLTVVLGEGGVGKGQLWADWTGRITTGRPMPNAPDDEAPDGPGSVLLVTSEDDANMSTAWRLSAAHADLSRVYDITEDFEIPGSLATLGATVDEIGDVRMVVIDPLADNLGMVPGTKRQVSLTSGNVTLRRYVMRPLERLARSRGIALVVIHHTVKSGRMAGSKGISDAARMVLRITRPDDTQPLRVITVDKTNIASGADTVGYTITGDWPDVHVSYVEAPSEDAAPGRELSAPDKVLAALQKAGEPLELRQVMKESGTDYQNARTALTRLRDAGLVVGGRGSPLRRGVWAVPGAVPTPLALAT